jgi:hypothetical protein
MPIDKPTVFLSYARKDVANVRDLYRKLKHAGYRPWMDLEDLLPGEDWELVVKQTIEGASFFIACLSTHSVSHEGVIQMEFKEALEVAKRKLSSNIFFIPVRLDDCVVPSEMKKYNWVSLHEEGGFEKLFAAIRIGMKRRGLAQNLKLRSEPIEDLYHRDIHEMIRGYGFFDIDCNWQGLGLLHQYEEIKQNGQKLVIDYTTELMWQQSGSPDHMKYEEAKEWIEKLNREVYAGFHDWRLPTLEEAISLMESVKNDDGLFINHVFQSTQEWIWTADKSWSSRPLIVSYDHGGYTDDEKHYKGTCYVRVVR